MNSPMRHQTVFKLALRGSAGLRVCAEGENRGQSIGFPPQKPILESLFKPYSTAKPALIIRSAEPKPLASAQ
jgi:hypothetical protein